MLDAMTFSPKALSKVILHLPEKQRALGDERLGGPPAEGAQAAFFQNLKSCQSGMTVTSDLDRDSQDIARACCVHPDLVGLALDPSRGPWLGPAWVQDSWAFACRTIPPGDHSVSAGHGKGASCRE